MIALHVSFIKAFVKKHLLYQRAEEYLLVLLGVSRSKTRSNEQHRAATRWRKLLPWRSDRISGWMDHFVMPTTTKRFSGGSARRTHITEPCHNSSVHADVWQRVAFFAGAVMGGAVLVAVCVSDVSHQCLIRAQCTGRFGNDERSSSLKPIYNNFPICLFHLVVFKNVYFLGFPEIHLVQSH